MLGIFDFTWFSYGAGEPVPVGGGIGVGRDEYESYRKKKITQQVLAMAMRQRSVLDNLVENNLVEIFALRVEQKWEEYQRELGKMQGKTILAALVAEI